MSGDRYAESEHIREHPAYREGYDRGYRNGYMEAMQCVVDEILPAMAIARTQPMIIPIQNIDSDMLAKMKAKTADREE